MLLEIKDLHAGIEGKEILKGLNLSVNKGEIHAIMGPNGSGKSTLAKVLTGHPGYQVTSGEVLYEGKNLFELDPDERARLACSADLARRTSRPGSEREGSLAQQPALRRQLLLPVDPGPDLVA